MMKKAWGSIDERKLEEIELIDIRDKELIAEEQDKRGTREFLSNPYQ